MSTLPPDLYPSASSRACPSSEVVPFVVAVAVAEREAVVASVALVVAAV